MGGEVQADTDHRDRRVRALQALQRQAQKIDRDVDGDIA